VIFLRAHSVASIYAGRIVISTITNSTAASLVFATTISVFALVALLFALKYLR
jgi:molybdopterin-binding protein